MYTIALTGGLGAGKSTAARFFGSKGAYVIDLDALAAEVLSQGSDALDEVSRVFGEGVLTSNGELDRHALAQIAFASSDAVERLNAIVHPQVMRRLEDTIRQLRTASDAPEIVVIEVPLLGDVPELAESVDTVLSIEAPAGLRVDRAARRGMDPDQARARISAQGSDGDRVSLSDEVIQNEGALEEFLGKLESYWMRLQQRMAR